MRCAEPDLAAFTMDGEHQEESRDDPAQDWWLSEPPPREQMLRYAWRKVRELCLVLCRSKRYEIFSMSIIVLNTVDMCLLW